MTQQSRLTPTYNSKPTRILLSIEDLHIKQFEIERLTKVSGKISSSGSLDFPSPLKQVKKKMVAEGNSENFMFLATF